MKIVFMGTPAYAVPSLTALHEKHEILAVYTQPDRPAGRGHQLVSSAVKQKAEELGLTVIQPKNLRTEEAIEQLRALAPDLIAVIAYGIILPQAVLDIPVHGCLNAHGSLLPLLRGASPIQEAILQGFSHSGVTLMHMDAGMDTGDMLLTEEMSIEGMTFAEVSTALSDMSARLFIQGIDALERAEITAQPQNHAQATYTRKITKQDGFIDFQDTAKSIYQRFLALQGWPGLFTLYQGQPLKILDLAISEESSAPAGTVTEVSAQGINVATTEGSVLLKRIQLPGKKALDVAQFLLGHKIEKGLKLGK